MTGRIGHWIDRIEETLLVVLMIAMTLVTFSQVVARYVFNSGVVWALELTVYIFAWLVLLGASMLVRQGAHIGVDALVNLFGPRVRRRFGLAAILASLLYAGLMLYGAWDYVSRIARFGIMAEDLPVPLWVPLSVLPLGVGLLCVRLLQALTAHLRGETTGLLRGSDDEFAGLRDPKSAASPTAHGASTAAESRR